LMLNHTLQYAGAQLGKDDIGKVLRAMPYANGEECFNDLTMDYDVATNDILALDRGKVPPIHEYDNHVYMAKRLVARTRQADFEYLPAEIKNNYAMKIEAHQQAEVVRQKQIQAAEAGFIPTDGPSVVVDFYVSDPLNPGKTRRARLPFNSIQWLIDKLEQQGNPLDSLEQMGNKALQSMADQQTMGRANSSELDAPDNVSNLVGKI